MKRKKAIICLLLLVGLSCVACTKNEKEEQATQAFKNENYNQLQAQANVFASGAFSELGYYFINDNILYFYDLSNEVMMPVCSKTNCNHNASSCDAYIDDNGNYDPYDLTDVNINCLGENIWYEDGKLYMVKRDVSGDYLMEYDKTFSNEANVCTVAKDGTIVGLYSKNTTNTCNLYDGYLYYFSVKPVHANDMVDYTVKITCNRIKVDKDAKPEILGEFQMAADYQIFGYNSHAKICIGNDMVYFVCGGTGRMLSKTDPVQYRIYSYEISSGKFSEVLNKNADDTYEILGNGTGNVKAINSNVCSDKNDNLYIATDSKIVKITKSGETDSIYTIPQGSEVSSMQWYDEYVYFYEAMKGYGNIVKIDSEGNIKGKYVVRGNKKLLESYTTMPTVQITIMGVDANNVLISTRSDYIEGMECDIYDRSDGAKFVGVALAIGIVKQEAFEDNNIPIKCIYSYKK